MQWLIKDPAKVNSNIFKQLISCTPTWAEDYMTEAIKKCKNNNNSGKYLAIALFEKEELLGWGMLDFPVSRNKTVRTYVYVKLKHRRKGYGTKIINRAKKIVEKTGKVVSVCPHDKRSREFFKKQNISKNQVAKNYRKEYN